MAAELDKIDLQILKILQENGRITNLQLQKILYLSHRINFITVLVKTFGSAVYGIQAITITVEVNIAAGTKYFIVGFILLILNGET